MPEIAITQESKRASSGLRRKSFPWDREKKRNKNKTLLWSIRHSSAYRRRETNHAREETFLSLREHTCFRRRRQSDAFLSDKQLGARTNGEIIWKVGPEQRKGGARERERARSAKEDPGMSTSTFRVLIILGNLFSLFLIDALTFARALFILPFLVYFFFYGSISLAPYAIRNRDSAITLLKRICILINQQKQKEVKS